MRRSCLLTIFRIQRSQLGPYLINAKKLRQKVHVFGTGSKNGWKQRCAPHATTPYLSVMGMSSKGAVTGIMKLIFFTSAGGAGYFPHHR